MMKKRKKTPLLGFRKFLLLQCNFLISNKFVLILDSIFDKQTNFIFQLSDMNEYTVQDMNHSAVSNFKIQSKIFNQPTDRKIIVIRVYAGPESILGPEATMNHELWHIYDHV